MRILVLVSQKGLLGRPDQAHGHLEVFYCREGSGVMTVDGASTRFGPGDILCIPPGAVHRDHSLESRVNVVLHFPDVRRSDLAFTVLHDDASLVFDHLLQFAFETQLKGSVDDARILGSVGDALYEILRGWGLRASPPLPWTRALERTLLDHLSDPGFDLSAAVRATGYTDGYVRRAFRRIHGQPPLAYLNGLRIAYARNLLGLYGPDLPVREVAAQSGFADPLYFSRLFRKATGRSPRAYAHGGSADGDVRT